MNSSAGSIRRTFGRARSSAGRLCKDISGIAAVEFAVIAPVMLLMFFGTVELTSAIAIKRKVTTMARTASDLTSQSATISNADLTNFFAATNGIMTPYDATPAATRVTELYIDPASGVARVQWSQTSQSTVLPALAAGNLGRIA